MSDFRRLNAKIKCKPYPLLPHISDTFAGTEFCEVSLVVVFLLVDEGIEPLLEVVEVLMIVSWASGYFLGSGAIVVARAGLEALAIVALLHRGINKDVGMILDGSVI